MDSFPLNRRNGPWECRSPKGCLHAINDGQVIEEADLGNDIVKLYCSNMECNASPFAHLDCFEVFEDGLVNILRSLPRAKNWSEKQRSKNLWTAKGYELIFRMCECECGRGHMRRDLDWIAPQSPDGTKKKKKVRPFKPQSQMPQQNSVSPYTQDRVRLTDPRRRADSLCSNNSNNSSDSATTVIAAPIVQKPMQNPVVFRDRPDLSAFNVLPPYKVNTMHIKVDDPSSRSDDNARHSVLKSFAVNFINQVPCVLCNKKLYIYQDYPLLDGTFFMSPVKYHSMCVKAVDKKFLYITAICLSCLEGWTGGGILCRFCETPFYAGTAVLGTIYSFDLVASFPCCKDRLTCKRCGEILVDPDDKFRLFDEYSKIVTCHNCGVQDYHFIRPIEDFVFACRLERKKEMAESSEIQLPPLPMFGGCYNVTPMDTSSLFFNS